MTNVKAGIKVDKKKVVFELIEKSDADIEKIIRKAKDEYFLFLKRIAEDIYDSCIAIYYKEYKPRKYNRHGHPEGKNLYQAKAMSYRNGKLSIAVNASNLDRYGNSGDEKKQEVLDAVMSGWRGTEIRLRLSDDFEPEFEWQANTLKEDWPMPWTEYCVYPNEKSQYGDYWKSTKNTMNDILSEFVSHGEKQTSEYFWQILDKYI